MIIVMSTMFIVPAMANSEKELLDAYYGALQEVNDELGTEYSFPTEEQLDSNGYSYSNMIDFYTSMSISEFKNYIISIYESESESSLNCVDTYIETVSTAALYSYTKTQKYYYSTSLSNTNYIYIKPVIYNDSGVKRYESVTVYGEFHNTYPYYEPYSMKAIISSDGTYVTCKFSCNKYSSAYLVTSNITRTVKFKASGGNVRATASA